MFVNFKAQRLSDSHSGGPEKNEEHLLSSFGAACNRLHHRTSERWLPLVFHFGQIDEFVVPGHRMDSFPILVDDLARRDNWRECGEIRAKKMARKYIYQLRDWPGFTWDPKALAPLLSEVRLRQGLLVGKMRGY